MEVITITAKWVAIVGALMILGGMVWLIVACARRLAEKRAFANLQRGEIARNRRAEIEEERRRQGQVRSLRHPSAQAGPQKPRRDEGIFNEPQRKGKR